MLDFRSHGVTLTVTIALLLSCSSNEVPESGTGGSSSGGTVCEPGKQETCACHGGLQGIQKCREDGSGWKECECPDGSPGAIDGGAGSSGSTGGGGGVGGTDGGNAGTSGVGGVAGVGNTDAGTAGTSGVGGVAGVGGTDAGTAGTSGVGGVDSGTDGGGSCGNLQTDPLNCGSCGHDCMGGACEAGECQPHVFAANYAIYANGGQGCEILLTTSHVYWTDTGGTIFRKQKSGGNHVQLTAGTGLQQFAADTTHLYWAQGSQVLKMPLAGGPTETVQDGLDHPWGIAVNSTDVFWSIFVNAKPEGYLTRFNKQTATSNNFAYNMAHLTFLAVDEIGIYWSGNKTIYGADLQPLGAWDYFGYGAEQPGALALDAQNVYWLDIANGGRVIRTPRTSPGVMDIIAESQGILLTRIAVDGSSVFWTIRSTPGFVMNAPIAGGAPKAIAIAQDYPTGIATDAQAVYWVNSVTQKVMRLAR